MMTAKRGSLLVIGIIFAIFAAMMLVVICTPAQTPPKKDAQKTEAPKADAPKIAAPIPVDDTFTAELEKTKALSAELDDLKRESGVTALEQRIESHGASLRGWIVAHKIPDGWTYDASTKSFVAPAAPKPPASPEPSGAKK